MRRTSSSDTPVCGPAAPSGKLDVCAASLFTSSLIRLDLRFRSTVNRSCKVRPQAVLLAAALEWVKTYVARELNAVLSCAEPDRARAARFGQREPETGRSERGGVRSSGATSLPGPSEEPGQDCSFKSGMRLHADA